MKKKRYRVSGFVLVVLAALAGCGKGSGTTCATPNAAIAGTGCTVTWTGCSNGVAYQLDCTNTPPSTSTNCTCRANTVTQKTFNSTDLVCSMAGSAITGVANSGCGWELQ